MATTKTSAKQSGYVPRKVAREIKKRAMETRKAEREKKAKVKEKKDVSAKWQGAYVPPDIRRPWDVFHQTVLYEDNDRSGEAPHAHQEDLHALQELGALRAFQALPACRQRVYTAVSLQELSAFAAWSATSGLADAMERVAAWTGLDADLKADHLPHNWRALLAKDPTWHVFIADLNRVKEEAEEHQEREGGDEEEAVVPELRGIGRKSTPGAADAEADFAPDGAGGGGEFANDLNQLPLKELRSACRELDLSCEGSKSDLIARLVMYADSVMTRDDRSFHIPIRKRPAAASTARPALGQASGVSPAAGTSAKAAVAGTRHRPKGTQGAADDDKNLHKPVRKRPAAASTARPALGQASGVSPAAGTSAKATVAGTRHRPKGTQGATDDDKNLHKPVRKRTAQQDQRHVDKLDAKYPWGRKGGPPPASDAEQRSLAEQMARLRIEAGNFGRPERADGKRLAHANTMLDIMRGKARAGFGGGLALATRGLSLNRSAGLAIAKRARRLALALKAHCDPEGAPSVQIEEGIAMTYAWVPDD